MFFKHSKSESKASNSFYIGNIPTRPGRQQINMDGPIKNNNNEIINPRIGEFKTTSGYHPVRPAINISNETKKDSNEIKQYNTNHIILNSSDKNRHYRFWHHKRKV